MQEAALGRLVCVVGGMEQVPLVFPSPDRGGARRYVVWRIGETASGIAEEIPIEREAMQRRPYALAE